MCITYLVFIAKIIGIMQNGLLPLLYTNHLKTVVMLYNTSLLITLPDAGLPVLVAKKNRLTTFSASFHRKEFPDPAAIATGTQVCN
jgi:hypothetical protein